MLDVIALQYVAFIPMIPTALIGFYFEHEDEIKAKIISTICSAKKANIKNVLLSNSFSNKHEN